jgi:predicted transcriptional regulator YdeE
LCRAVKQTLGFTPSEYKNNRTYYFFPPFNGEPLQSVIISNETIPHTLRVLFYHSGLMNIENMAINTFLQAFPNYNRRIFGRNGKQDGNKFCYELYLTDIYMEYDKLKEYGFHIDHEIPCFTAMFATSTVQNDEYKINAAWDYLFSEWLQNSMFEYTDEPYYEEYILKNGKPKKLKLYLPIRKREEDTKISLINNPGLQFITAKAKGYNAEEIASQTVIDYLTAYYPYIINTSKEIYLRKETDTYICGVKVSPKLQLVNDENVVNITTAHNNYLMLESSVMGDYDRYAELLYSFSKDNGMDADRKKIFAVYDAKESLHNLKIKMYCPVKIHTK